MVTKAECPNTNDIEKLYEILKSQELILITDRRRVDRIDVIIQEHEKTQKDILNRLEIMCGASQHTNNLLSSMSENVQFMGENIKFIADGRTTARVLSNLLIKSAAVLAAVGVIGSSLIYLLRTI